MTDKLHHTKGIVLRNVKYGESSLIISIYTELFGLQSYLVNGVRTNRKNSPARASLFQPTAMLDMIVYHNDLKQLQRIKEFKWDRIYQRVLTDVPCNAVAQFMVELFFKCVKQPEPNEELYSFVEDAFIELDKSEGTQLANFPLFFALHLPVFFGFRMHDNYSAINQVLDLQEGDFTPEPPSHGNYLDEKFAFTASQLLKVQHPSELGELKMNQQLRRKLLDSFERYYALHLEDFGVMRSLPILREILS